MSLREEQTPHRTIRQGRRAGDQVMEKEKGAGEAATYQSAGHRGLVVLRQMLLQGQDDAVGNDGGQDHVLKRSAWVKDWPGGAMGEGRRGRRGRQRAVQQTARPPPGAENDQARSRPPLPPSCWGGRREARRGLSLQRRPVAPPHVPAAVSTVDSATRLRPALELGGEGAVRPLRQAGGGTPRRRTLLP